MDKITNRHQVIIEALHYSKNEVQQADNRIFMTLTVNSIILTVTLSIWGTQFSNISLWISVVLATLPFLSLISILILVSGLFGRYKHVDKSIWNFLELREGVTEEMITNFESTALEAIKNNSRQATIKYAKVNLSLMISFVYFMWIFLLFKLIILIFSKMTSER